MAQTPPRPRLFWRRGTEWFGFVHLLPGSAETEDRPVRVIAWGPVLVALGALGLLAFFYVTVGAWAFLRYQRGYTRVEWTDVALPWQWATLARKQGEEQIAQAERDFTLGRWRDGFFKLRSGVRRVPENLPARRQLASLWNELGRSDIATEVALEGLPYAGPADFLYASFVVQLLLEIGRPEDVVRLAEAEMPRFPPGSPTHLILAFGLATALDGLGRQRDALEVVTRHQLNRQDAGIALEANLLWNSGQRDAALAVLALGTQRHPNSDPLLVRFAELAELHGSPAVAGANYRTRVVLNPDSGTALLSYLWFLRRHGPRAEADAVARQYLERFGGTDAGLLELARQAIARRAPDLFPAILERARPEGDNADAYTLLHAEALIAAGQYAEGNRMLTPLAERIGEGHLLRAPLLGLAALAQLKAGTFTIGEAYFDNFLQLRDLRPGPQTTIAGYFVEAGLSRYARRILSKVLDAGARNFDALARMVELDVAEGNTTELHNWVTTLLRMQRPLPVTLRRALVFLESDHAAFVPERDRFVEELRTRLARVQTTGGA